MATITQNGASYYFRASVTISGKRDVKCMTWRAPVGTSKRDADRLAKMEAARFEERVRRGEVFDMKLTFEQFSERFMKEYAEVELKNNTINTYRMMMETINFALGKLPLVDIRPKHIMDFEKNLAEEGIRRDTKFIARKDILAILKKRGLRKQSFAKACGIGYETFRVAFNGRNVSYSTAKRISNALDMDISKLFKPIGESRKYSQKTLLNYHRFISTVLQQAVYWGVLQDNVCKRVRAPKASRHEAEYLNEEQTVKLLEYADMESEPYRTMIHLLVYSGLRRGECCALQWQDIDFEKGCISVERALVYTPRTGLKVDTPKTQGSIRTISIPAEMVVMLRRYKAHQSELRLSVGDMWEQGENWIFTQWNGKVLPPDSVSAQFRKFILKHPDLPQIHVHSLRHTSATLLIAAGIPLKNVSSRLGHSMTSTTANIYAHALASIDETAAEALSGMLNTNRRRR
jgi:integrase